MPENVDQKIALAQEIIKGGISVILSLGLLGILGFNAWTLYNQTDLLKASMRQQTELMKQQTDALKDIRDTYRGH
jgi:flagellin-specific chaperone FliS